MNYIVDYLQGSTPPHKHDQYEIIIFTDHKNTLRTFHADFSVGSGKIAILPPGTVHHCTSPQTDFGQIYILSFR